MTMSRITSVSIFATSALAGLGLFLSGFALALDALVLGGFSLAVVSLFFLAAARDYSERPHRFEPALIGADRARLPLAA